MFFPVVFMQMYKYIRKKRISNEIFDKTSLPCSVGAFFSLLTFTERAVLNPRAGQFWATGRVFDTPGINKYNSVSYSILCSDVILGIIRRRLLTAASFNEQRDKLTAQRKGHECPRVKHFLKYYKIKYNWYLKHSDTHCSSSSDLQEANFLQSVVTSEGRRLLWVILQPQP